MHPARINKARTDVKRLLKSVKCTMTMRRKNIYQKRSLSSTPLIYSWAGRPEGLYERVLNHVERTRLSRHRMIWRLSHLRSESSIGDTQEDWERETNCCRESARGGGGYHTIRQQGSLVLHKKFFAAVWIVSNLHLFRQLGCVDFLCYTREKVWLRLRDSVGNRNH